MKIGLYAFLYISLLISISSAGAPSVHFTLPPYHHQQLPNGFEMILVENHTNPLIATVVVIRTGLRNETPQNNGVSHMLEHLIFNGTARRTQKELYDELDYYGIYLNAQTSEDYTSYMALHHRDYLPQAMDILSDMLFHSNFPEEKFEKEKGIIVEEIRKDSENPDYQKEQAVRADFYRQPPYSMPVIGTMESVQNMTRQQVVDYYHRYYRPNNMIALIVGDFNESELRAYLQKYFGDIPAGKVPENYITLQQSFPYFYQQESTDYHTLYIKLPAPTFFSADFIPFYFFQSLALDGQSGKIIQGLKNNQQLKITEIHSNYEFHPEFGCLTLKIDFGKEVEVGIMKKAIVQEFEKLKTFSISRQELSAIKQSYAISEILATDKILYYGFLKAQELSIGGRAAFEKIIPAVLELNEKKVSQFIQSYPDSWAQPERLFANADWPRKVKIDAYQKKSVSSEKSSSTIYEHTLPNGMKVLLLQNADSDVLAMHFLFKNRAGWEPPEKIGIADFLHHSLFISSAHYPAELLPIELKNIGAEVKAYDWDFIPYDDYYNVPEYSYLRILTLDPFLEKAFAITVDNLLYPDLAGNFEKVKKQMSALVGRQQSNASQAARIRFLQMIGGENHPLSRPVSGNPRTIESITVPDLQNFHKEYFTAGNIILSIVSGSDSATVMGAVEKHFAHLPPGSRTMDIPPFPETFRIGLDSLSIGTQQSYIYWGYSFSEAPEQEIPLKIMNEMLNSQIQFSLREQKGWAYRLGSTMDWWKDRYLFHVTMGTGRETTLAALAGIQQEIADFKVATIDSHQLTRTKNSMLGGLVRRRSSRETQAFVLGINEFYGYSTDYFFSIYQKIKDVTAEHVQCLKEKNMQIERAAGVYTIPSAAPTESKMRSGMPKEIPH